MQNLLSPAILIVVLFLGLALWEHLRPKRAPDPSAGWRWLANGATFVLFEAVNLWLTPLLSFLVHPSFDGTRADTSLLRLAAVLVAIDALQYGLHRLSHMVGWLWRLHAIHHTDIEIDVSTTIRHHPVEAVVTATALAGIATLAGFTPFELALYGLIEFPLQSLAHANVALPPWLERAVGWLIVTPTFHRFHHSLDPRQSNANYGQILTVWDRLFRSLAPGVEPAEVGVADYRAPKFQSLGWILLQPVVPRSALGDAAGARLTR